jgi:hypothetical protein
MRNNRKDSMRDLGSNSPMGKQAEQLAENTRPRFI